MPESVGNILHVLDKLQDWVKDFPPTQQAATRFGNKAFRDWHARLSKVSNIMQYE